MNKTISEIKVGDICKANGYAKIVGIRDYVFFNDSKVKVIGGDNLSSMITVTYTHPDIAGEYVVHPKQCRKLVKKIKCDKCGGLGKYILEIQSYYCKCADWFKHPKIEIICDKCNGTGKSKINR